MYDYNAEIIRESRRAKKRWNGKAIASNRQWVSDSAGALAPAEYNLNDLFGNAWAQIRQDTEYYGENYRSLY